MVGRRESPVGRQPAHDVDRFGDPVSSGVTGPGSTASMPSWSISNGNGRSPGSKSTRPAAPGTTVSIAAARARPSATTPGRLKTLAPSSEVRLAATRVLATSAAYWYSVGPLNDTRYGIPSTAATIALVGPLVMPWSRPTP